MIACFFILQIPPYALHLKKRIPITKKGVFHFKDLTGDGVNETILQRSYYGAVPTLRLSAKDHFISEIKLDGDWINGESLYFHDLDMDGIMELFAFNISHDFLILSLCSTDKILSKYSIIKLDPKYTSEDFSVAVAGIYRDQIYFSVNAGFSLQPRAIFRVNLKTGLVSNTKERGAIVTKPFLFDLDKNGIPEIITRSFAPTNIHHDVPYSDSSAWLMVFDLDLNLFFPAVRYPVNHGQTDVYPIMTDTNNLLAVSYTFSDLKRPIKRISLYNEAGYELANRRSQFSKTLMPLNGSLYTIDHSNDRICEVNKELQSVALVQEQANLTSSGILTNDFFADEQLEVAMISDSTFVVYTDNLRSDYRHELQAQIRQIQWSSGSFFVYTDFEILEIQIEGNPWHAWKFPIILGIAGLSFLLLRVRNSVDFTVFNSQKENIKVFHRDIYYLEADGYATKIYTVDHQPLVCSKNMAAVISMIPTHQFVKTHRSFYVKKKLITAINKSARELVLKTPTGTYQVSVSKKNIPKIEALLAR